jgi:hypothetical protein
MSQAGQAWDRRVWRSSRETLRTPESTSSQREEEVVYELDKHALSTLPSHLQENMQTVHLERLERLSRTNPNFQNRYSQLRIPLQNLIGPCPGAESRSTPYYDQPGANHGESQWLQESDREEWLGPGPLRVTNPDAPASESGYGEDVVGRNEGPKAPQSSLSQAAGCRNAILLQIVHRNE